MAPFLNLFSILNAVKHHWLSCTKGAALGGRRTACAASRAKHIPPTAVLPCECSCPFGIQATWEPLGIKCLTRTVLWHTKLERATVWQARRWPAGSWLLPAASRRPRGAGPVGQRFRPGRARSLAAGALDLDLAPPRLRLRAAARGANGEAAAAHAAAERIVGHHAALRRRRWRAAEGKRGRRAAKGGLRGGRACAGRGRAVERG